MKNAQVSIEAVIVIGVSLFVFLGAILLISQKIELSKPVIDESKNFAECHKIAETISLVQSSEAVSEQTLTIENDIQIEKNNIIVGQTSCYYFGTVEGDAVGMNFTRGMIKISKDAGGKTRVSQIG